MLCELFCDIAFRWDFLSFVFNWQCRKKVAEWKAYENDCVETTKDKYLLKFNLLMFCGKKRSSILE